MIVRSLAGLALVPPIVLALAAVGAPGCGGSASGDSAGGGAGGADAGGGCRHGGAVYSPGDSFPSDDGCNVCSCSEDGSVACTQRACGGACIHQGVGHPPGAQFPAGDGCNTCTCHADGSVACTRLACGTFCEVDGRLYVPGESFRMQCNECTCGDGGDVACTTIACAGCSYAGEWHAEGARFPSRDGCNECSCQSGSVSCTLKHCECSPGREWWRDYVATSPDTCAVIDFGCPGATTGFENTCGCGCEQDPSCPETFDCEPPARCDVEELSARCPYSGFAF